MNRWDENILSKAKRLGYADKEVARLWQTTEQQVYDYRIQHNLKPVFKMVDTCAGEFEATTPYFYSSYDEEDEGEVTARQKVVVLGSGPIRIGQGIEFDYCSVHAVKALRKAGIESIIINNNPETVSTDFDTADRLYFEPLTIEDVTAVLEKEKPEGVVVQFGGQTAIGLCKGLATRGYRILGTTVEDTDRAEERGIFDDVLQQLGAKRPRGGCVSSLEEAEKLAADIGFPLIVRPSYVLGGRAMQIVYEPQELTQVFAKALQEFPGQQIWMDQYLLGKEVEVDAISDGETVCIPGIMEHLERAGIHSGDSIAVYPPQMVSPDLQEIITDLTVSIARRLHIKGLLNIQYVIYKNEVYVLEVIPVPADRTFPGKYRCSDCGTGNRAILGETLPAWEITAGLAGGR
jgi:carbamoyl-phosphate synthase large subunit